MKNKNVLFLTQSAMIAAIYVVLTVAFSAISFGQVQVRVAEALTILPVFTPAAIPGLFIGCLIGNSLSPSVILPDIIFGSLTTLIAAIFTYKLRKASPLLAPLPPIVANTLVIPFILRYAYAIIAPIPILMLGLLAGQVISCGILGLALHAALNKYKSVIFKNYTE